MNCKTAVLVFSAAAGLLSVSPTTFGGDALTTLGYFNNGNGRIPAMALTLSGNILYGTTAVGGAYGGQTATERFIRFR